MKATVTIVRYINSAMKVKIKYYNKREEKRARERKYSLTLFSLSHRSFLQVMPLHIVNVYNRKIKRERERFKK